MMIAHLDAVARIFKDGDPETVRLVKEQLIAGGHDNLRDLEALAGSGDEEVCRHAREVVGELTHREAEDDFDLYCRFFYDGCDIGIALWQLSEILGDRDLSAKGRKLLGQWGREFAVLASKAVSSRERVIALSNFMAGELCFRGNSEDYYNPRNSLLGEVVETRAGIPIALVMVWRMVALRAGMIVDGINLPGHFIARHEDVLFDPFHRGKILTRADCARLLEKQGLQLRDCHLLPATPRQTLVRMLANLLYSFDLRGETSKHDLVDRWLHLLCAET